MTVSVRVVPALLTDSPSELRAMVASANAFADYVQIDVMDGRFVPPRSIVAADLAGLEMDFLWEAHLMVSRPCDHILSFVDAGATRVVIHAESDTELTRAIALARRSNVEVGLALNPATPVRKVAPLLTLVDSVLLLTVEPGYYGSRFLPDVLPKIPELRALRGDMAIGVDGGIKSENIREVARCGVDDVCVGSAIFRDPAPAEAYRRLQQLVAAY